MVYDWGHEALREWEGPDYWHCELRADEATCCAGWLISDDSQQYTRGRAGGELLVCDVL